MKILIVEDEPSLREMMQRVLTEEHYVVETAATYFEADDKISGYSYDCILLDIMLPDGNGLRLLERLKELHKREAVIVISARDSLDDKVAGLELGADDYLTKPFDINEFSARVHSLVRRYTILNGSGEEILGRLSFKNLEIDPDRRLVTVCGRGIELQAKEFDILYYLAKNKGRALTKKQIYEEVWQEEYLYDDSNIMAHISKIRRLIEPDSKKPTYIQTIKGVGYRFNAEV